MGKMTLRISICSGVMLAALALPAPGQKLPGPQDTPPPADSSAPATPSDANAAQPSPPAAQPSAQEAPSAPTPKLLANDVKSPEPDAGATAPAYPVAEIVARINGQIISKMDLERAETQMNEQAKEENWSEDEIDHHKKQLLSDLIDQQLLLSRGKELNINPDDELIRRLDQIRKQNHLDTMEDLEKAAQSQGVSFEDFKANIRNSIITQQVIRDEVSRNIHLTSAEELAYYNAHKDQFTLPESVKLGEVLIPTGDSDAELADALARANKIHDELAKGSDFAEMAKSVSTGPTAAQGGELGVFKRGQLARELEDKTFILKTGQMTEPIRTKQGYVILKAEEHTPPGLQPFKDVEEHIQQQVYVDRMQPALRVYLGKLRDDSFIDIKPGYTDVNTTSSEQKPVFSAYTPPRKKAKKVKVHKQRFRDRSVVASKRAPAAPRPQDSDDTVTAAEKTPPKGGPTEVATSAYDATQKQQAASASSAKAVPVNASAAPGNASAVPGKPAAAGKPKKYKVRYGHGEKAAQLPPATTATGEQPAGTSVSPGDTSVEAKLTPESQQILGTPDAAPRAKTRFTSRPIESRTQARTEKAAAKSAAKNANAPEPADATEVATQAVNSAPLGLNGNTAAKPKAPKPDSKQRLEDKKTAEKTTEVAQANTTAPTTSTDEKKRHKLLGVF